MALTWPAKDPDEVLDYEIDWTKRLDGDTITSEDFIVAEGDVVVDSSTSTDSTATVWLSGGTLDEQCLITCRVVTAGGRTMDQSMKLKIKAK